MNALGQMLFVATLDDGNGVLLLTFAEIIEGSYSSQSTFFQAFQKLRVSIIYAWLNNRYACAREVKTSGNERSENCRLISPVVARQPLGRRFGRSR